MPPPDNDPMELKFSDPLFSNKSMLPLPLVVRMELQRAIRIHEERGHLLPLRAFAWVYESFAWVGKSAMWIFLIFVAYYWFFA